MSGNKSDFQVMKLGWDLSFSRHSPASLDNLDAVASRVHVVEVKQREGIVQSAVNQKFCEHQRMGGNLLRRARN
jgi:hypothetical protein